MPGKVVPEGELQPASNHPSRRILNLCLDGGVVNVAGAIGSAEIVGTGGPDVDLARVRGESGVNTWLKGRLRSGIRVGVF